ncbi:LLM class flavin-dependent oxidoreductase [Bacillus mycoides]|uniref:LLM class flavin-dependent oxidoreductase n=1 Tax=Bacillus mycoides TaxID=1405 RepID=UPI001C00F266|nr:LLM class flavin-dependent oxidoreductase [Bacillus mycoides]QWG61168.1 LLM class flavin-dependent oxidoreductase [Bacillus mycoides]QWG92263.1 LLM class flavin-dependent oxidoreductase [Bacillus mycoides]QWH03364.1 LLM class flavin-dependent oxidoreductase [Bacillus mycoides]QWJ06116.1 LLM class flavin-dependent oxidoreductase [Bacillus mycoides]
MKLSVLDQTPVSNGVTTQETFKNTIELAQLVDKLGYHRIWYSEHHGSANFASASPEIMISHIASVTEQIRVGSGGMMLMHHSPLKMAEVFKTLTSLYPDRIDFGVGRAPGGNQFSTLALHEGKHPNMLNLYDKLMDTMMFMTETMPADHLYNRTLASPLGAPLPEVWLLGSSGSSAAQAGRFGIGYSYAQFISGELSSEMLESYRKNFVPSEFMVTPKINIGYFALAAETAEEAEYHAASLDLSLLFLDKGKYFHVPSPEEALNYNYTEMDKMHIQNNRKKFLVGSAKEVANTLREHEEKFGVNEAMIGTISHNHDAKLQSYGLLAKELL